MTSSEQHEPSSRPLRLQFRLRTLLVVVALLGIGIGWVRQPHSTWDNFNAAVQYQDLAAVRRLVRGSDWEVRHVEQVPGEAEQSAVLLVKGDCKLYLYGRDLYGQRSLAGTWLCCKHERLFAYFVEQPRTLPEYLKRQLTITDGEEGLMGVNWKSAGFTVHAGHIVPTLRSSDERDDPLVR